MSETTNLTVFLDTIGRTILGEAVTAESSDSVLVVKNPAVVHITPNPQSGQLQLQILPLLFREFLADKDTPTVWKFNKANITESVNTVLDFKLAAQYNQIFSAGGIVQPAQPQAPEGDVIRLFDEE